MNIRLLGCRLIGWNSLHVLLQKEVMLKITYVIPYCAIAKHKPVKWAVAGTCAVVASGNQTWDRPAPSSSAVGSDQVVESLVGQ